VTPAQSTRRAAGGPLDVAASWPALTELEATLAEGHAASVAGAGTGADALVAALVHARRDAPTLVISAEPVEAERLACDLETLAPGATRHLPPAGKRDDRSAPSHARRVALLEELLGMGATRARPLVVASLAALWPALPDPTRFRAMGLSLEVGAELDLDGFVRDLEAAGYEAAKMVQLRGEFARRGGLVDIYGHGASAPLRVELFGDQVEGLRVFDPGTQVSVRAVERARISLIPPGSLVAGEERSTLFDYLPSGALAVVVEPAHVEAVLAGQRPAALPGLDTRRADQLRVLLARGPRLDLSERGVAGAAMERNLGARVLEAGDPDLARALAGLGRLGARHPHVFVYCDNLAQRDRLAQLAREHASREAAATAPHDAPDLRIGRLTAGFAVPVLGLACIPYHQVFGRGPALRIAHDPLAPEPKGDPRSAGDLLDLSPGDHVVHQVHGVGRFRGVVRQATAAGFEEYLSIEYSGGLELNVPATQAELVQRYVGAAGRPPRLDTIGGTSWKRRVAKVEQALDQIAGELLELAARRATATKPPLPADDGLQREFEASFVYDETADQARATGEIKRDLESDRPMDRLLCGDVGFGKTEVALRAAFKATAAGKQVAVLVPTTVLAIQHARTFKERLAGFAVRVESISRFVPAGEQARILEDVAKGAVDIVVGTHRLLSSDVEFKALALVIVDEEQRFGVRHKQRLRKLRTELDVLSLSATPIPRTLHMALVGARDISMLTMPPRERRAIKTEIVLETDELVRESLLREVARGGQAMYVHNRVATLPEVCERLAALCPELRFAYAHGQMHEHELEDSMADFVSGATDVLVATTIVENGLDLPRAGTIWIDRADRFGLAELHQLRGRVGRSSHQSYAYLVVPPYVSSQAARRRLRAIEEHSALGSGLGLAMCDLEIRGAGNLLGQEQSGHIAAVGYQAYCQLLSRAVSHLTGKPPERPPRLASVDLAVGALLPEEYVPDPELRLEVYGRLSRAASEAEIDALTAELGDRFGPLPEEARRLVRLGRLRLDAARRGINLLKRTAGRIVISGDLAGFEIPDDFPYPVRAVEPQTALVLLPSDIEPDDLVDLLERLVGRRSGRPEVELVGEA